MESRNSKDCNCHLQKKKIIILKNHVRCNEGGNWAKLISLALCRKVEVTMPPCDVSIQSFLMEMMWLECCTHKSA